MVNPIGAESAEALGRVPEEAVAQALTNYQLDILTLAAVCLLQIIWLIAVFWQRRQRRRAERQAHNQQGALAHAARLGIAGELTASVVHEVNQPLGAILSNVDAALLLLKKDSPPLDEIRDILIDVRADDLRANDVIHHLRMLLRKRDIEMAPLSLNDLVRGTARIMGNMAIRHAVSLRITLAQTSPSVDGDWTHLQQVLINLALNAMEAMADKPSHERQLTIRTAHSPDGKAILEVQDTGPGIPDRLRAQLFDTYFTTKADGLGMGLAIARNIVRTHGGRLDFICPPSGGTVFSIYLPARDTEADRIQNKSAQEDMHESEQYAFDGPCR